VTSKIRDIFGVHVTGMYETLFRTYVFRTYQYKEQPRKSLISLLKLLKSTLST